MTFDPGYVPQSVDFVIAHDTWAGNSNIFEGDLAEVCDPFGMKLTARSIPEIEFYNLLSHKSSDSIESLTRDSLVFLHGTVGEGCNGLLASYALAAMSDARIIVTYDPSLVSEFADLVDTSFPFSPRMQISYGDAKRVLKILQGKAPMDKYLRELADGNTTT